MLHFKLLNSGPPFIFSKNIPHFDAIFQSTCHFPQHSFSYLFSRTYHSLIVQLTHQWKILNRNEPGKTSRTAVEMPSKCAAYFLRLPQDRKPHWQDTVITPSLLDHSPFQRLIQWVWNCFSTKVTLGYFLNSFPLVTKSLFWILAFLCFYHLLLVVKQAYKTQTQLMNNWTSNISYFRQTWIRPSVYKTAFWFRCRKIPTLETPGTCAE